VVTATSEGRRPGMRTRIWTVVIVGEDTDSPRTVRVSRRAIRWVGVLAFVALGGIVATSVAVGAAHHRSVAAGRLPVEFLRDSLASLGREASELRVIAGLQDSAGSVASVTSVAAGSIDTLLHHADQLSASLAQVTEKLHSDADKVARTPSIMPTAGWLTSQFSLSRFHPILHKYLPHLGIDVAAPYGTTVVAPAAGTVIRAGVASGYGMVLEIDHGNGIVTKYGHLSRFLVREHQQVVRGQAIAEVGNSGLATGPHLHYEVHVGGTIVDPLTYVLPSTIPDPVRESEHGGAAPED
jgi:murein DD-endopeptidase MepM/ murein hydrolase activator NlpD